MDRSGPQIAPPVNDRCSLDGPRLAPLKGERQQMRGTTIAFEPDQTGERIAAIYIMRNPEKLGHVH